MASHEALDAKIDALTRAMLHLASTLSDAPLASNSGQRPLAEQAFSASDPRGLGPAGNTSGIPLPFAAAAAAAATCVDGQLADDLREHSPTSEFSYEPGNYGDDEALADQMREAFHQIRSADASLVRWLCVRGIDGVPDQRPHRCCIENFPALKLVLISVSTIRHFGGRGCRFWWRKNQSEEALKSNHEVQYRAPARQTEVAHFVPASRQPGLITGVSVCTPSL